MINWNFFKNKEMNRKAEQIKHEFKAEVKEDGTNEITIYGAIGDFMFREGTSASDVKRELNNMIGDINIRLNSPGGDAFDGIAIRNLLKQHDGQITVYVDGWAASAASVISMAGDKVVMGKGTMLMIHEGMTVSVGNKTDMRKDLTSLEKLDESIADVYMTRFKGERGEIETMMMNETWFTTREAVAVGLADEVYEDNNNGRDNNPEAFKNSVLARFCQPDQLPAASANKSILNKFKRPE